MENTTKTSMETINAMKGYLKQTMKSDGKTVEQIRQESAAAASQMTLLPGTKTTIANLPAEWVKAGNVADGDEQMILYFHGGTFISGSCDTYRDLAARISQESGVRVLVIEYRLAPEHTYPAANEDCLTAYRWLIQSGISATNIVIGGDSVGGYLALKTLLALRDAGEPLPQAAFMLSPHTDFLNYDGESYTSRAELDPMGSVESSRQCADYYFDSAITDPAILSPLYEDLSGLPPLFIQVGDHEVILSRLH